MQHAVAGQAALGALGAMADRGERGLNRIAGADALPMLGWEVEECHEFLTVLLQTQRRLGILRLIGFDEQIKARIPQVNL